MPIWLAVWILLLPFACLGQPLETQILLAILSGVVLLGRRFLSSGQRDRLAVLAVTPLVIGCLIVGNVSSLHLAAVVLLSPLALTK